ncbi:thiamine-phosphate pyrophosphorylase [Cryobacterium sp. CAN_C3]|uniref:thiamine phosphate synthase n=1 Tax=unclassified Cryobacterium TaxID=2649013 RepID=UPI0018C91875|nr:thiamine phosphate synthase [Cryobacterium sp. CAN_C3]MEC5155749.1 thiamine-phosphate pyrophosphorylase [Cryobacterium sp. CAN_C3]
MSLDQVQLYLCTNARKTENDFPSFLDAAFAGGVDVIQLRDKSIEAAEELELLSVLRAVAERRGKLWAVNDRADIAVLSEAPVLHVGQKDLSVPDARRLVGKATVIGRSSHTPQQVSAALVDPRLDYFCVGPVWATPTKPGRSAVGAELVRYAAEQVRHSKSSLPWFAIGGIDLGNVQQVVAAGASRVVVVRAITEADDPTEAARQLRACLPSLA